ncbi:MAG: hypothetical protein ACI9W2_000361 [Gammaproteobacteria bacterium]|jgi:hypothetical protein
MTHLLDAMLHSSDRKGGQDVRFCGQLIITGESAELQNKAVLWKPRRQEIVIAGANWLFHQDFWSAAQRSSLRPAD